MEQSSVLALTCCKPAFLLQVTYTQGATEPGSSGAALIDADTRKVVGILTGGTTTCDVFSGADYFGRLDVVRAWFGVPRCYRCGSSGRECCLTKVAGAAAGMWLGARAYGIASM